MNPAPARFPELTAPANWRVVDFISDLHLQASEPATVRAWEDYMRRTRADAVFILGDLFEVWVGDDVLDAGFDARDDASGFEAACTRVLREAADRCALFFMHGNRDFLIGDGFSRACGATLLPDPSVLVFAGERWLLSHGDALCLDDQDYQQFRQQVRGPDWQQAFLARPLAQRRALARELRAQSEARKRSGAVYADADATAVRDALSWAGTHTLIHGHTHRPADHDQGGGLRRLVLSDWDAAATPARAQVLRLSRQAAGVCVERLDSQDAG